MTAAGHDTTPGSDRTVALYFVGVFGLGLGLLLLPAEFAHYKRWLDLASASIQGVITTPSWSITKPIPANPALTGVQLNLQGWFLPGAAFPAETTNGLHLVVGN